MPFCHSGVAHSLAGLPPTLALPFLDLPPDGEGEHEGRGTPTVLRGALAATAGDRTYQAASQKCDFSPFLVAAGAALEALVLTIFSGFPASLPPKVCNARRPLTHQRKWLRKALYQVKTVYLSFHELILICCSCRRGGDIQAAVSPQTRHTE